MVIYIMVTVLGVLLKPKADKIWIIFYRLTRPVYDYTLIQTGADG